MGTSRVGPLFAEETAHARATLFAGDDASVVHVDARSAFFTAHAANGFRLPSAHTDGTGRFSSRR